MINYRNGDLDLWRENMRSATKKVSNNVEDEFSITMELQRPLLEDEVYNNEYEINYKKDRLRKYIKIGLVSIVLIFLLSIATWIATSYKPGQLALDSLVSDNNVTVSVDGNITFTPKNKEVTKGFECGVQIENYNDIKEGDIIEAFIMEEVKR